ncbi:O-antigen ligase [Massilia sp. 9I]|uniref:O-antigen ligase family protein n=1 Tax=Massilia sp. 9I TaxID=2653152 RepID=UPI0012F2565E|nr:O-antigen ligase family protein [Massilia sp. 9I]VXB88949.1 conserved membrane hypothetical protein [Massilia sp. 9I]
MNMRASVAAGMYSWEPRPLPRYEPAGGRIAACYRACVLALAVVVLYANLPIYGYVLDPRLLPKFAFAALCLLLAPLVLLERRMLAAYLLSPFALWSGLLLLVNLAHLAGLADGSSVAGSWLADASMEARRAAILTRVQYILFVCALGFVVHAAAVTSWLRAAVLLALLLPGAVLLDFLAPGLFYPLDTNGAVLGRAAAMFINPNMAGEAILLILLLAFAATPARWRAVLCMLAGGAVLCTFSRAAILGWALLIPILAVTGVLPRRSLPLVVLVLGLAMAGLGAFEGYLNARSGFDDASENILARLDFFSSFSLSDDSAEERTDVLVASWELFRHSPVFGAGAGATQFWSHRGGTHNQLLLLAAEYGLFGVGLWAWMAVILWRGRFFSERGLQVAMVFLYLFMSLFTHAMLDGSTFWLASFAIVSVRTQALARPLAPPRATAAGPVQLAWTYARLAPHGYWRGVVR